MKKEILFLTTANLTTNPRCLKEVQYALKLGYAVTIIAFYLGGWSAKIENEHSKSLNKVSIFYIDATRSDWFNWFVSSIVQKLCQKLFFNSKNIGLQCFALDKRSFRLIRFLKRKKIKADLVVAHNLGAFYPAYYYSKKYSIPLAIDIEDYHPGEVANKHIRGLVETHMKAILSTAHAITYASPLIQKKIESTIELKKNVLSICINNVFNQSEFVLNGQKLQNEKLQIVWFSQNIDYGRGLEYFLKAADDYCELVELTVIGNPRDKFMNLEIKTRSYVKVRGVMSQSELHKQLSFFDVGLALEYICADENRDICLTNKIWSYLQAGLYILASDTQAQKLFARQHTNCTQVCSLTEDSIKENIYKLIQNKNLIRKDKESRILMSKKCSWENESQKLLVIWQNLLEKKE